MVVSSGRMIERIGSYLTQLTGTARPLHGTAALVEETENLATGVLLLGFLVVHDASGGGQDHEAELAGRQQVAGPLVHAVLADVETGRDDASLVDSAQQGDDDLVRAVVVDDLVLTDVAVLLHDVEELEDDLGAGAEEHCASEKR